MNPWEDAPWRGGRAGGYSRRPLEGDPVKGSSSKSVWGAPEPRHPSGIGASFRFAGTLKAFSGGAALYRQIWVRINMRVKRP
jgi:hypothetical protein